jgi:S-adenosyl-L-methionine hydrolase (adenosine-forming)
LVVITLLSDFGLSDPYVAQMKGVIRSTAPAAEVIDISHGVEKHNIGVGSYLLETTAPFFPDASIHVAVVDPGVGGSRLPIAVACERGVLIGPDNGLLARTAQRLRFQAAYQIENSQFNRDKVFPTFYGRDVFAYTAAKIAQGRKPSEVGAKLAAIIQLDIPDASLSKNLITCSVLYVDSFGNIVTNISEAIFERLGLQQGTPVKILTGKGRAQHDGLTTKSYFDIPSGRLGLLLGSQGYLELAMREASAAETLRVRPLGRLEIGFS